MASYVSVLELRPLLSPCCCASLASPLLQQSRVQMMAASFCAFLTALVQPFMIWRAMLALEARLEVAAASGGEGGML